MTHIPRSLIITCLCIFLFFKNHFQYNVCPVNLFNIIFSRNYFNYLSIFFLQNIELIKLNLIKWSFDGIVCISCQFVYVKWDMTMWASGFDIAWLLYYSVSGCPIAAMGKLVSTTQHAKKSGQLI
jgi:hypothetical protein